MMTKDRQRTIEKEAKRLAAITAPGMHKAHDGVGLHGLYLQIRGPLSRSWILRFTVRGRTQDLGLGSAFLLPLTAAAERADKARLLLAEGINPLEHRRAERTAQRLDEAKDITFREVAEQYVAQHSPSWKSRVHLRQWESTLATYVYPSIGSLPIQAIDVAMVLDIIRPLWTEKTETASRIRGRIEAIVDYATPQYRTGTNPAAWKILKSKLPRREKISKVNHHAALPYAEIPAFMSDLRTRTSTSARALEFTVLTWARSSEALGATWDELDFDKGVWTVPAARMKGGREHRVPLPPRAVEIARELYARRESNFVFPGARIGKPLSSASMSKLLDIMGRSDVTLHGFRSTARTWAAERTKFAREVAEAALAHAIDDKVEAAYQRGTMFDKRRALMTAWAELCARPAAVAKIVSLHVS
jgi:integrase